MKISESSVALSSSRSALQRDVEHESLRIWRDGGGNIRREQDGHPGLKGLAVASAHHLEAGSATKVSLSDKAQALQPKRAEASGDAAVELSPEEEFEFLLLKKLVEYFTNREVEVFKPSDVTETKSMEVPADPSAVTLEQGNPRQGWGVSYDYYASHYESESTRFAARALVHTADGREISVDLELNMSREFHSSESFSFRAGDARLKDPLIINFDGKAAELTRTKFAFDIDADGREDQIAFVSSGSGFLALDKNNNGSVDDGSELFGALSGNGFADLATFDQDGNQWLDENDSIYNRLRIWSREADGSDRLVALGDADVGAIYLGHVSTEFKLADTANIQQGQIRESGLYLKDSGGAGTVQQIDLVA